MIQDRQQAPFPTAPAVPRDYVCTEMYTIQAGDTLYSISQRYNVPVSLLMQANNIMNPYCLKIGQRICIPRNGVVPNGTVCSGFFHTIAAGDTPYLLAKRYGVSLESILEANPGMNPHNLMIGAQICIPGTRPAAPPMTPAPPPAMPAPTPVVPSPAPPPARPTPMPVVPSPVPPPARPTPVIPTPMQPPVPQAPAPMPIPIPTPIPGPIPTPAPAPTPPPAVPSPPSRPPVREGPACSGKLYTVAEGDTLYMIAKRNEVSLDALMEANPSLDPYSLEIGMKLCIPPSSDSSPPAPCPAPHERQEREDFYSVRVGDSMDKICSRFRVLPRNLMKANPTLTVVDYSIPGTRVCIPSK